MTALWCPAFSNHGCFIMPGTQQPIIVYRQYGENAITVPNPSAAERLSYLHNEMVVHLHVIYT